MEFYQSSVDTNYSWGGKMHDIGENLPELPAAAALLEISPEQQQIVQPPCSTSP